MKPSLDMRVTKLEAELEATNTVVKALKEHLAMLEMACYIQGKIKVHEPAALPKCRGCKKDMHVTVVRGYAGGYCSVTCSEHVVNVLP